MPLGMTLEICVDSLELAQAAVRGGADRIELCGPLDDGGITPSADLAIAVRKAINIPIAMLVRQRTGPFTVSDSEFEAMKQQIGFARRIDMDIVVLGILRPDKTIDLQRTRQLVQLAHPMHVTFHRAFDESPDLDEALQAVMRTGATRLLTSGASASAVSGTPIVDRLQHAAGDQLSLIVCGGITPNNIASVLQHAAIKEVHAALRRPDLLENGNGKDYLKTFTQSVSELKRQINQAVLHPQS
jgi:copper homeostasis protein